MGERRWLMERIAAEPEVTVRGLMTELVRQTETSHAKGQGASRRRYLETHRLIARNLQIQRMQKLPRQCRLRFILK
jgi:hypothetical protein